MTLGCFCLFVCLVGWLVDFWVFLVAKSCPTLVTSWTVACQAPLSMGFSRQDTGVG